MRKPTLMLAVSMLPAVIFGVACGQGDADPVDDIMAEVHAYAEAMKAADQEAALAFFSENWGKDGATKEDLTEEFVSGFFGGVYPGVEVDLDQAEVEVDGDTAIVGPVIFRAGESDTPYLFEMKKESDGRWRAVYSEWMAVSGKDLNENALTARDLREKILSDPSRPSSQAVRTAVARTATAPTGVAKTSSSNTTAPKPPGRSLQCFPSHDGRAASASG